MVINEPEQEHEVCESWSVCSFSQQEFILKKMREKWEVGGTGGNVITQIIKSDYVGIVYY